MARDRKIGRRTIGATTAGLVIAIALWITGWGCWLWYRAVLLTSGAWSAIAAWATFAVAIIAAFVAYGQVKVARQIREEQAQPNVVAYTESTPHHMQFLDIVIRNFGTTPAYNVVVDANPEIRQSPDYEGERPTSIQFRKIKTLAPGQEVRTLWDYAVQREEYMEDLRQKYERRLLAPVEFRELELVSRHEVVVRYEDSHHRKYEMPSVLDFDMLRDTQFLETLGVHDLTKRITKQTEQIKKIADALGNFSQEHKGIWVYPSDADGERQYWIDYRQRVREQNTKTMQRIREAQARNAARSQDESDS